MPDCMITIHEAAQVSRFPIRKWFQWVLSGLISSVPELKPDSIKGISYKTLSKQVLVPVSSLPKHYQEDFLKQTLLKDSLFSVDFFSGNTRLGG